MRFAVYASDGKVFHLLQEGDIFMKIGSVVRLNSGGPNLTVCGINDNLNFETDFDVIEVDYFNDSDEYDDAEFYRCQLILINE